MDLKKNLKCLTFIWDQGNVWLKKKKWKERKENKKEGEQGFASTVLNQAESSNYFILVHHETKSSISKWRETLKFLNMLKFFLVSSEMGPCPHQCIGRMEGREEGRKRGRKEKSAGLFLWYKAKQAEVAGSDPAALGASVLMNELLMDRKWDIRPVSSSTSFSHAPFTGRMGTAQHLGMVSRLSEAEFLLQSLGKTPVEKHFTSSQVGFSKDWWGAVPSCFPGAGHGTAWVGKDVKDHFIPAAVGRLPSTVPGYSKPCPA